MTDRLRARLAYIREFAGNVAHEFRTPISTLRGTVELLQHDAAMPEPQRVLFLGKAMQDLDRMDRLLTGLLLLARAEEGEARAPLALAALAERVADRYPEVRFEGGAGQLESALSNLIENALRYGGPDVDVVVAGWIEGDQTGFDVIDDGPGISAGNLSKLFERFFTTDRQAGGTGLGLAIVRAESRPGRTRFRIALAVAAAQAQAQQPQEPQQP